MCVHLKQEQGAQTPCPGAKPILKAVKDVLMHILLLSNAQNPGGNSCYHWHWADVALPGSRFVWMTPGLMLDNSELCRTALRETAPPGWWGREWEYPWEGLPLEGSLHPFLQGADGCLWTSQGHGRGARGEASLCSAPPGSSVTSRITASVPGVPS